MPTKPRVDVAAIHAAQASGESIRKAAARLGLTVGCVTHHWPRGSASRESVSRVETSDSLLIESVTRKPIRTEAEAIAYHEVDTRIWYVDRFETTDWEMGYTTGPQAVKVARTQPLTRVRLHLKRIAPRAILDGLRLLRDDLAACGRGKAPQPPRKPPKRPGGLLEVDLFDVHFGKLAWAPETGQDYDLKIAESRFERAVEDLLNKASGWRIDRILFPVGNDLLHIDNRKNTTESGTMMDVDSRYARIWACCKRAVIRAVDRMLECCPVDILWVPGNHDFHPSFHLVDVLGAYYRSCKSVNVDESPSVRKVFHWGANLIGFQHGDTVKGSGIATLPDVLTSEAIRRGIDLRTIVSREFHLGHRHHERTYVQRDMEEVRGTKVRWLASLSSDDFWHHENLFVGSTKAATGHLYDYADGFQAQILSHIKPAQC